MFLPALLAEPVLTVPTGYLTLGDLLAVARKAGVAVRCDPRCDGTIYAASLRDVPWSETVRALRTDESLEIEQNKTEWTIRPNRTTESRERTELRNYLVQLSAAYMAPFQKARALTDPIFRRSPDQWEELAGRLRAPAESSLADRYAYDLAQSVFMNGETKYATLTLPQRLSTVMLQGPGAAPVTGPLWSLMAWLMPPNAIKEYPKWFFLQIPDEETPEAEARRKEILSGLQADLRWHLDPQSGAATVTLGLALPFQTMAGRPYAMPCREVILNESLGSIRYHPRLDLRKIVGEPRYSELGARQRRSEALFGGSGFGAPEEIEAPEGTFADLVLRAGRNAGSNVLFRPPSFFNARVPARRYVNAAEALAAGTLAGTLLRDSGDRSPYRLGLGYPVTALALDPALGFEQVGSVLTVVDDLRFLEALADGPPVLSTAISNRALTGEPVTLSALMPAIAALRPATWRTGALASATLDYGDPSELYAFARLYAKSPDFRKVVEGLRPGRSVQLPFTGLPEDTRRILIDGILAVERTFPDRESHSSPSAAAAHLANLDAESLKLRVQRVAYGEVGVYRFAVLRDEEPAWSAEARNVAGP